MPRSAKTKGASAVKPVKASKATKARGAKPAPPPTEVEAPDVAGEITVVLGADLRIGGAREVYQALTQPVRSGATLVVQGEDVAKVDAAGVQSIVAALVYLRTAGTPWRWHNPSPALKSAAQLLGLDGALEIT